MEVEEILRTADYGSEELLDAIEVATEEELATFDARVKADDTEFDKHWPVEWCIRWTRPRGRAKWYYPQEKHGVWHGSKAHEEHPAVHEYVNP
jgi:hypothetical protein